MIELILGTLLLVTLVYFISKK